MIKSVEILHEAQDAIVKDVCKQSSKESGEEQPVRVARRRSIFDGRESPLQAEDAEKGSVRPHAARRPGAVAHLGAQLLERLITLTLELKDRVESMDGEAADVEDIARELSRIVGVLRLRVSSPRS